MPQRESDTSGGIQGMFERLGRSEERIGNLDRRVENLESKNESLARLAFMVEAQSETNKQQNEQIAKMNADSNKQSEKVNETLSNINSNLILLNGNQTQVQKDVAQQGVRVSAIEEDIKSNTKDWAKRIKDIVFAIILAYLMFKFGFK